jgi:hypothetical protein
MPLKLKSVKTARLPVLSLLKKINLVPPDFVGADLRVCPNAADQDTQNHCLVIEMG